MKPNEEIIGEAVRVEYSEIDGKLFVIFEITNVKYKQFLKTNWTDDIEFKLIDKNLIKENEQNTNS